MDTSQETEDLMRVVEDKTRNLETRAEAARRLGDLKAQLMVNRLLAMLPGGDDVVTREVIIALGKIGDCRALPVLEPLFEDNTPNYSGKIRGSLEAAIRNCRKNLK